MLTPPRVRRRFQGAGGFGPLSVRFCARFSANMRTWANTLCSRVRGESCHRLRKRVLNHRIIACCGRRTTAVFARGVLCTFWPQKVPKTPRQMPPLTSSRLTFETGARLKGGFKGRWAAERVISDTTLSLLKPASYAGARAFSRAFVSRLRHRAGIFRRNSVFSAGQRSEHANMGEHPMFACSSLFACSRFLQGEDRRSGVPMAQVRKFFVLLPLVRREYEDEC